MYPRKYGDVRVHNYFSLSSTFKHLQAPSSTFKHLSIMEALLENLPEILVGPVLKDVLDLLRLPGGITYEESVVVATCRWDRISGPRLAPKDLFIKNHVTLIGETGLDKHEARHILGKRLQKMRGKRTRDVAIGLLVE